MRGRVSGWRPSVWCRRAALLVGLAAALIGVLPPAGAAADGGWIVTSKVASGGLDGVSCVSSTFCAAVGAGAAYVFNGSTWTQDYSNSAAPTAVVSCSSSTFCVAGSGSVPEYLVYDGTKWTEHPLNGATGLEYIQSVSCLGTFCLAVDGKGNSITYDENTSSWSAPVSTGDVLNTDVSVSCVTSQFCEDANSFGQIYTWDGSGWSSPTEIDPTFFLHISCATTTFCAAVDFDSGKVTVGSGSSWSIPQAIDGIAPTGGSLKSISCAPGGFCMAGDSFGGNLLSSDGSGWSSAHVFNSNLLSSADVQGVSCPSASFCAAVNAAGDVGIYEPPTVQINSPANDQTYVLNQVVATSFSCTAGADPSGLASCVDSNGATGGTGTLDTSTVGSHAYSVTATSPDGRTATATLLYKVIAKPPDVTTGPAGALAATSATLSGTVNPNQLNVTDCHFEYGTTSAYGSSTPCEETVRAGSSPVTVYADPSGLQPGTEYHYRLDATNAGGTTDGGDETFQTLPSDGDAGGIQTNGAVSVTATGAFLQGQWAPTAVPPFYVSACYFDYGTTPLYGSISTSCAGQLYVPSGAWEGVGLAVNGLQPNTTYYYRLVVEIGVNGNYVAGSWGSRQSFTTLPLPPTVTTTAATNVLQAGATLNGSVNPNGGALTDCHFEYGTTTAYGSTAPCVQTVGGDTSAVAVSGDVPGLQPGTTYHFRLDATNAGGTSTGGDQTFTTATGTAIVTTGAAGGITDNAATLSGTISPGGASVTDCHFEYGSTTSYGSTAPCTQPVSTGQGQIPVYADLAGLDAGTGYHYRLDATIGGVTYEGGDEDFVTAPSPGSHAPTVQTTGASNVTQTSAFLGGTYASNAGPFTSINACYVEYGTTPVYGNRAGDCSADLNTNYSGSGAYPETIYVSGLQPGTTYYYRFVVTDGGGTGYGSRETFTTPPSAAQVKLAILKVLVPHGKLAKIASVLKAGGYTFSFRAPSAGSLVIFWTLSRRSAHRTRAIPLLVATGRARLSKPGAAKITIRLTRTGRRLLSHANRITLTANAAFTAKGVSARPQRRTFTLRR